MKRYKFHITITLISLCFLQACTSGADSSEQNRLARVGDTYLTIEQARKEIPRFMLKEDSLEALKRFRERWIQRQVVLQETERVNLRQNNEVRHKLRRAQQEVLTQALKDYVIGRFNEDLNVTEEEARNYYQAHKDQFILNERFVQFRHVETTNMASARAAKRELLGSTPWPEVARKYSINPEIQINESKQFWPMSMAMAEVKIMNRYLEIIGQNEISPIQRVNRTYHFVQLTESRAEGEHPDLEWLIKQIKDWLILDKRRRHYNSYVKNLYLKAKSNNEIESYNVLEPNAEPKPRIPDTLDAKKTNE